MRLVLASDNAGKLAELNARLQPLGVELLPQRALGVDDAAETASTFVENALIKARHAAQATGLAAIADDSGLVVPALGMERLVPASFKSQMSVCGTCTHSLGVHVIGTHIYGLICRRCDTQPEPMTVTPDRYTIQKVYYDSGCDEWSKKQ